MAEVEWVRLQAHELHALADQEAIAIVPDIRVAWNGLRPNAISGVPFRHG
jgi:hypothetical protein